MGCFGGQMCSNRLVVSEHHEYAEIRHLFQEAVAWRRLSRKWSGGRQTARNGHSQYRKNSDLQVYKYKWANLSAALSIASRRYAICATD